MTLIGLSTILGSDQAIFILKPQASKASVQANSEETIVMNVGERHGVLELLAMNVKDGTAKIRNDGAESMISIRTNAPGAMAGGGGGRPANTYSQPTPGFPSPAQGGYNPKAGGYNPAGANAFNPVNTQPQANNDGGNPIIPGSATANMNYNNGQITPAMAVSPDRRPDGDAFPGYKNAASALTGRASVDD